MKNIALLKRIRFLPIIAVNILLFVAVLFLMHYVQNLLNNDVKINLSEVVTQNKDVITSKFKLEINNILLVAELLENKLIAHKKFDIATVETIFWEYVENTGDETTYVALLDGTAIFADHMVLSVAGRKYFKLAAAGIQNTSERIVSRHNGEEIFVISVPLYYYGQIIGTVQKPYSIAEMYEICSISLYSAQGTMNIINSEGYIMLNSQHNSYNREFENYIRYLYGQGNQEASKQLENDIKNKRAGFMETIENGKKFYSAYTPIEELHDWFLISSIANDAISGNAATVIKIFYCVLSVVVLVFVSSLWYFFSYKNRQQTHLEHIAFVDTVTGGNTFTKFAVDMQKILDQYPEKQFYVLKFDIDNFKYVNNFYGFDFGDRVLCEINAILTKQLAEYELIARISSDHFVMLLEDASLSRIQILRDLIENIGETTLYFSAGLYKITDPQENLNLMVDKASAAALIIKGNFNKTVEIYTEKFDRQMIHNEQMKRAIKRALKEDEIIPFYQPKVNIFTEKLAGAEVLARWRTNDGKIIPPSDFIPLCEKTGLIIELDMIIFEKALQFLHRMRLDGIECYPISVNFSRLHLGSKEFITTIVDKLQHYEIPPDLIEIELTETIFFENYDVITDFIKSLHDNGLRISMDDFGSGYSSLNMLKDFPIDVLKIDRGFLMETTNTEKRNIILSSITQMINRLNVNIVVEGVETPENVSLMKKFGCSIAQGFYFAKPMNEEMFEKIFREGIV